jgi:hypothetical protein
MAAIGMTKIWKMNAKPQLPNWKFILPFENLWNFISFVITRDFVAKLF